MVASVKNDVVISDSSAQNDADLVERFIVARDQAAFALLVHRHGSVVLGVCRRVLRDANDIDDVFQATFLVLVRDAKRVRKRTSLASWLYGVAYRLALRVARTKQRRRETILMDDTFIDDDTLGKLASRHEQKLLDDELNALPERYRQPLVLRYLAEKFPNEIANELGTTVGAVEGLLKRGKDELRRRLLQRGVSLGAALIAVQYTQQAVQAASTGPLIEATIQAGLAWNLRSNTPSIDLVSDRAVEIAGKEIIAMTATTKTTLVAGLTLGGLIAGMGGAGFLNGPSDGNAAAAGINTTLAAVRSAGHEIEMAMAAADPAAPKNVEGTEQVKEEAAANGPKDSQPPEIAGDPAKAKGPTSEPSITGGLNFVVGVWASTSQLRGWPSQRSINIVAR